MIEPLSVGLEARRFIGMGFPVVIVAVYLFAFLHTAEYPESRVNNDSAEYLAGGENFWTEGVYYSGSLQLEADPRLYSRRPPLYALLAYPLFGTRGDLLAVVQCCLVFFSAWWLAGMLKSADLPTGPRLVALGYFLLMPAQWIYSNLVMAEVLLQFFLVFSAFSVMRYLRSGNPAWLLGLNLALALGTLTKPVLMFVWVPNLVFHGWLVLRRGRRLSIVFAAIPILAVAGWSFRNLERTGYFHFTSLKADQMKMLARESKQAAAGTSDFGESSQAAELAYYERLIDDLPGTTYRFSRGMGALMLDPGRFDFYEFLDWRQDLSGTRFLYRDGSIRAYFSSVPGWLAVVLLLLLLINVAVSCAFLWWVWKAPVLLEFKVFVGGLVAYLAILTGPIGTSRYRLAIAPFLALALAPAVQRLSKRVFRK